MIVLAYPRFIPIGQWMLITMGGDWTDRSRPGNASVTQFLVRQPPKRGRAIGGVAGRDRGKPAGQWGVSDLRVD